MTCRTAILGVLGLALAACAPAAPPPAPAPAQPPPAAAAPAPEALSTAPIPIRSLSCADLLGASDDDRAAASMFFIGFRAALAHVHGLSISQIEAIEETALATCAKNPKLTASTAFAEAVATRKP